MKAARFHGPDEGIAIEEHPRPEVEAPEDVVVEVAGAGVCHSDLHILHGDLPLPETPITLGHENAGYVAETGEAVETVEEGDAVAVYGPWGCRSCDVCFRGEDQLCDVLNWVGVGHDGGYAEYLRVPSERYLVPLDRLSPVEAAPLTDAATTAYRTVKKAREATEPDADVAVIGVGALGGYAVQLASTATSGSIYACDVEESKLERAGSLGATHTLNTSNERLSTAADDGFDAVLDFVGTEDTLQQAASALSTGGNLYVAGIGGGSVSFGWNLLRSPEITMESVFWGSVPDLRSVVDIAEAEGFEIEYETVGFDELREVFERLEEGDVEGRAVLTP